jgi:hypothetical protein
MKRLLPLVILFWVSPAQADLKHTISASTSLTVNAAATQAQRIGSSFSISGTGVDAAIGDDAGRISAGTVTSGVYNPGTVIVTQNATGGEAFSFSQSFTQADAISGAAPSVGAVPNFSNVTSTAAGTTGALAGTITSPQVVTVTAGGAGTSAVGQVVTTLEVD